MAARAILSDRPTIQVAVNVPLERGVQQGIRTSKTTAHLTLTGFGNSVQDSGVQSCQARWNGLDYP